MNASSPAKIFSTGIPTLDELFESLRWGESVVFHGGDWSEFVPFVQRLGAALEEGSSPGCSFCFGESELPRLQGLGPFQQRVVLTAKDLSSAEQQLSNLVSSEIRATYLFSDLGTALPDEGDIVSLFQYFAQRIAETESGAYVFLQKGSLSNASIARIVDASFLFLDIWTMDRRVLFQPIRAAGRYAAGLFMPYQLSDGKVAPASELDTETYTGELEKKSREFLRLYTEKRHLENELQRKVFELSLINGLTTSLLSTMNLEEILYRILVGVTAKEGLGFNRAFLLLVNEKKGVLEGKMAIGPSSLEEAIRIWTELSDRHLTYHDLLAAFDSGWPEHDAHVNRLVRQISVPLEDRSHVLIDLLMQTQPEVIGPGGTRSHTGSWKILDLLGVVRSAAAPLVYRKRQLGLLMADNLISHKPISEDDLHILETFANYASAAIEHSRLYEEVRLRMKESERHIIELEAMQNRLMRSKRLSDLGELASKMAHELRTPLVSIGGFANGLLKRHSPESADYEELKIIVDEVRRLEAIIRNVLAYVSPGLPRTQSTDLRELSDKVLRLMQSVLETRHIQVSTQYFSALPRVSVDPEQIQLVVTAIINNAMESMPDGGRLTVAIHNGQGFVRLSIADTGAGIRKEDLQKVFDAFFTTKSLGSGLGLNIASQIIANHKGSIYAESQVGIGSTFFINFPVGHFEEEDREHDSHHR